MNAPRQVGFIGTGIMGAHMVRRLAAAGHRVQAWNRTVEKARSLTDCGVAIAPSAADAARGADTVICMLSSGPVCDEVLLGDGRVLAAMRPGSSLIVMSSIPVETARLQPNSSRWRSARTDFLNTGAQLR